MVEAQQIPNPKDLRIQEARLNDLYRMREDGLLTMNPVYQRGSVWNDERRYALVDSVHQKFPLGVVMLEVKSVLDADGEPVDHFSVVDGQQRLQTLFDYIRGEKSWTHPTSEIELYPFTRFQDLGENRNRAVRQYEIPVAYLRNYSSDDIESIFLRVQFGMALTAGEKLKNVDSPFREAIREITGHSIYSMSWSSKYTTRDLHWMLSSSFFISAYKNDPFQRFEYKHVHDLLRTANVGPEASTAPKETAKRILNRCKDILNEASSDPVVNRLLKQAPRSLKMLFASIYGLDQKFAIYGREPDIAEAVIQYLKASVDDTTLEGIEWGRTLRSGRMDTDDVKSCVSTLANYIVNVADLQPIDPERFFNRELRRQILERAEFRCEGVIENNQRCGAMLSEVNFHADHILPHSQGGRTIIANGQALCAGCNSRKGASKIFVLNT